MDKMHWTIGRAGNTYCDSMAQKESSRRLWETYGNTLRAMRFEVLFGSALLAMARRRGPFCRAQVVSCLVLVLPGFSFVARQGTRELGSSRQFVAVQPQAQFQPCEGTGLVNLQAFQLWFLSCEIASVSSVKATRFAKGFGEDPDSDRVPC